MLKSSYKKLWEPISCTLSLSTYHGSIMFFNSTQAFICKARQNNNREKTHSEFKVERRSALREDRVGLRLLLALPAWLRPKH